MTLIHVQTIVQTVFGVLDSEGNVIEKKPVSVEVTRLDRESFGQAADALIEAKAKMAPAPDASPVPEPGN